MKKQVILALLLGILLLTGCREEIPVQEEDTAETVQPEALPMFTDAAEAIATMI